MPDGLPQLLAEAGGKLLIPGAEEIGRTPELLVRLSRLFGPEVEDYRFLPTARAMGTRRSRKSSWSRTQCRTRDRRRRGPSRH
jgi:hypothetical protein